MYAKVNIMENEETGKPLHEFYKSLVLGDLGEAVIDTMCTMGIMDGEYKSTLKGDTLDRVKGIDAFIGDTSIQVKLDARACETGNVALEVAEFKFSGGQLKPPTPGALINPQHEAQFVVYVMPGIGVSVWKPSTLKYLLWYWQTKYTYERNFEDVQDTFRHVVAENKGNYMSLSYLVPYKFMTYHKEEYDNDVYHAREPLLYRDMYNFSEKKWEHMNYQGASKFYHWGDYLAKLQQNLPVEYEKIIGVAVTHANRQNWKPRRDAMLQAWGQRSIEDY